MSLDSTAADAGLTNDTANRHDNTQQRIRRRTDVILDGLRALIAQRVEGGIAPFGVETRIRRMLVAVLSSATPSSDSRNPRNVSVLYASNEPLTRSIRRVGSSISTGTCV